jgi:glycosyltransferase involved in cell wall biosynthesis
VSSARNAGIREARGELIAFLDADDRIRPEKLGTEVAVFDAAPGRGIVYSGWRCIDENGVALPESGVPRLEGALLSQLVLGNLVHPHAPLVRRDAVLDVGGFDESLSPAADWDLWLRLARRGLTWTPTGVPSAEYRIRPDAMHKDVGHMHADCLRVLDKFFADTTLPSDVIALRARAYQNLHLRVACAHYRLGQREAGAAAFRSAVVLWPAVLTEPRSLRRLYPLLLPEGHRTSATVLERRADLSALLAEMLRDLYAGPNLDERIKALRWRARIAHARARAHFFRRRAAAAVETAR